MSTQMLQSRGGMRYEVHGDGEPILLIHGAYIESALVPLMRRLELTGFQIVHYHRRGYGGSIGHDGAFSIEQETADALDLLDELSIPNAHVVGYSSGGVVAYNLTVSHPNRVAGVSLIEPALQVPGSSEQGMPPFLVRAFSAYESGDIDGAIDAFWSVVGNPEWRASIQEFLTDGLDQVIRNAHIFFELEAPKVVTFPFTEADARTIRHPVAYFVSDGAAPSSAELRALVQQWIPQTKQVLIEDADHALPLQQPELIGCEIAGFLAANSSD